NSERLDGRSASGGARSWTATKSTSTDALGPTTSRPTGDRDDWRKCTPKARQPWPAREQQCEEYAAPSTTAQPWHVGPGRRCPPRGGVPTGPTAGARVSPERSTGRLANLGCGSKPLPHQSRSWLGVADCAVQKKSSPVFS